MPRLLAELILKAANTREGSYVVTERAWIDGIRQSIAGYYEIDLHDACVSACVDHPNLVEPVRLMLENSWNQALDWATEMSKLP